VELAVRWGWNTHLVSLLECFVVGKGVSDSCRKGLDSPTRAGVERDETEDVAPLYVTRSKSSPASSNMTKPQW
jgi:hypothetical protein